MNVWWKSIQIWKNFCRRPTKRCAGVFSAVRSYFYSSFYLYEHLYNQLLTNYNQSLERDRRRQLLCTCFAQNHCFLRSFLCCTRTTKFLYWNLISTKYIRRCFMLLCHLCKVLSLLRLFFLEVSTWKTFCFVLAYTTLLSFQSHLLQFLLLQFSFFSCLSLPYNLLFSKNLLVGRIHL
jgi:hypothetical protein